MPKAFKDRLSGTTIGWATINVMWILFGDMTHIWDYFAGGWVVLLIMWFNYYTCGRDES